MKHRILYLLSALCILLTGCSALPVNTGDEIAYWTGETPFNAAVIPAAPTCTDGVFYADGQALPTETFSGTLPEGQLTFLWCQYDGQIFLQNQQEDWSAEPISGSMDAALCRLRDPEQLDQGRYALAWLESGQLTWLLPDLLTPYGIWQLEVSPDLQQAIFLTRQADRQGAFYCDGQQVVDLASACGIAEGASPMLTARWLGADILVTATDDGSQESRLTDVYGYDCATELARPTVSRAAAYIPQRQEDGLQFYTGAAYATYRQNGTLWVTNLRTGETHDTGVSADAPYHICTVGEDIAVVQEQ